MSRPLYLERKQLVLQGLYVWGQRWTAVIATDKSNLEGREKIHII